MSFNCLLSKKVITTDTRSLSVISSNTLANPVYNNIFLNNAKTLVLVLCLLFAGIVQLSAQTTAEQDAEYVKTINGRAAKIVSALNLKDKQKAERVQTIVADQYRSLNDIHTARDLQLKQMKAKVSDTARTEVKLLVDFTNDVINRLHKRYIFDLSAELTPTQVDEIKNGMTYNVVPNTYKGYMAMLPNLTPEQKNQIMNWLVEARENAIDAETSDKKHWWFGKYKGKINNYLSASGIDMKKASEEWESRIKAEKSLKN